jgi:ribulose-phosphate 3-epimerase
MSVEPGFAGQAFIPESLDKISELRKVIDDQGLQTQIFVDGGVGQNNAKDIINAGADVLVAASAVLRDGKYQENILSLKS